VVPGSNGGNVEHDAKDTLGAGEHDARAVPPAGFEPALERF
jgi:hypothetical protein